jgi:hypothetical protein
MSKRQKIRAESGGSVDGADEAPAHVVCPPCPAPAQVAVLSAPEPLRSPQPLESRPALPSPRDLLYWEDRVADSLGIARDRVREIRERDLISPKHFFTSHGAIVFTDAGLARLLELVNPTPPASPSSSETMQPPAGPAPRAELRVVRVPINSKLLICAKPDGQAGETVVRVRANENFRPGMMVPVLLAAPNFWQHYGRLPRRKGHW